MDINMVWKQFPAHLEQLYGMAVLTASGWF